MADYSWIEPSTKNIANLFGLNPEAAAKGRALQSQQEYDAARTANTQADTGLSPYRQRLLEAQAQTQAAQAGKYGADTTLTGSKTKEQELKNSSIGRLLAAGQAATRNVVGADGKTYSVFDHEAYQNALSPADVSVGFGRDATDVERGMNLGQGRRLITSGDPEKVRTGTILSGQAAAGGRPDFAPTNAIAQTFNTQQQAADQAKAVEVAKVRGSIAQNIAGGQPGQPNQMELNRQAEGIKAGAEWAMKVPFQGGFLDEGQAYQLAQAARAANPSLNPQDAITKFVRDNPNMLKGDSEWFGKNKVEFPAGIPVTVPAAPAARPVAPAPATAEPVRITNDDSGKAAYARLPSGTPFVDPNGQRRIKP